MPGVCRLGDKAKVDVDAHGCPACPHHAIGPAISASSNVYVNGMPALRLGDIGMHAACCGPNMWTVIEASGKVFINGSSMVRKGDLTQHCGGIGKMVEASGNVNDNSPMMKAGPFGGLPLPPPLPMNEVLVFPSEEPFCPTPGSVPPGLPLSGDPQIYNQQAAEAAQLANQPHAEAMAPGQQVANAHRDQALRNFVGAPPDPTDQAIIDQAHERVSTAKRALDAAQAAYNAAKALAGGLAESKKKAAEAELLIARSGYNDAVAAAGPAGGGSGGGGSDGRGGGEGEGGDAAP